jgi:hypothetical protein
VESVPGDAKPKAIARIMTAGVLAAVFGPTLAIWAQFWLPPLAVGPFALIAVVLLVNAVAFVRWLNTGASTVAVTTGRPISAFLRDAGFLRAASLAAGSNAIMAIVMVAAPLAIVGCSMTPTNAASVVQWHLVAMYAPAYVVSYTPLGRSTNATVALGCAALVACLLVLASGNDLADFLVGLALLGVGWNFTYVGATAALTTNVPAVDQPGAQGLNELILWIVTAAVTAASGLIYAVGWHMVLLFALANRHLDSDTAASRNDTVTSRIGARTRANAPFMCIRLLTAAMHAPQHAQPSREHSAGEGRKRCRQRHCRAALSMGISRHVSTGCRSLACSGTSPSWSR